MPREEGAKLKSWTSLGCLRQVSVVVEHNNSAQARAYRVFLLDVVVLYFLL